MTAGSPRDGLLHENLERSDEIIGPSDRRFGLTLGGVAALIGTLRVVLGHPHWVWWVAAGVLLAALALSRPAVLAPLNRLWLKVGFALHKVVNPIVMALLFYTVISPTGILMRLCGKDPLRLRREPGSASYWIMRAPPGPAPETMKNQF
jgi:hypothetical protein